MRYIYTCIYAYMYIYISMYEYIYMFVCMYVCMYVYLYLYVYVYVYIYMYVYVCVYIYIYILFHPALGNVDGGVKLVYESACCLAWGVIFDRKIGVLSVSSLFQVNASGSVSGCVCLHTHTHTHYTDGVLEREPRSRDQTPGGPEESRWTKSRHTYIRVCVQITHVYVYTKRRDAILD